MWPFVSPEGIELWRVHEPNSGSVYGQKKTPDYFPLPRFRVLIIWGYIFRRVPMGGNMQSAHG